MQLLGFCARSQHFQSVDLFSTTFGKFCRDQQVAGEILQATLIALSSIILRSDHWLVKLFSIGRPPSCFMPAVTDVNNQNLIPLVLRPMRLFLPTENLRSVRITLLKATHFPHVLAIMLYENLRQRVTVRRVSGLPSTATVGANTARRPDKHQRYSRSRISLTPQPLAASHLKREALQPLFQDNPPDTEMPEAAEASISDDLKAVVARLTEQVQSLTQKIDSMQQSDD